MANQGAWGGGGRSNIPGTVKRTANVTRNTTSTSADRMPIPGETPLLKYVPEPNYAKTPFNPDLERRDAKASGKVKHGR